MPVSLLDNSLINQHVISQVADWSTCHQRIFKYHIWSNYIFPNVKSNVLSSWTVHNLTDRKLVCSNCLVTIS